MTKKLIYLLRHGAVELPDSQAMVGQIDLPLSAKGIRQSEQWRDVFAKHSLNCIYCSDLRVGPVVIHRSRVFNENEFLKLMSSLLSDLNRFGTTGIEMLYRKKSLVAS